MQRLFTGPAMVIAVVIILMLTMVGCGGGSTGLDANGDGGFGLISPSEVPHATSVTMPARTLDGTAYVGTITRNTTLVGPGLAYNPTWDAGHRTSADIAYAIYMFPLEDYSGSHEVILTWDTEPTAGTAWIGLANFPDDSWDWSAYSGSTVLEYTPTINQDGLGTLLVAVVVLDETDRRLDSLRIGLDEEPVADLTVDYATGWAPLTVTLTATGSTDAEGALTKYEFDPLGDGTWVDAGTTPEYPYEYTEPGVYYPALRVTDTGNTTAVTTAEVYVGWQHSWGGSGYESGVDVVRGPLDNTYTLGLTTTFGQGANEHFITKFDEDGEAVWQRTFGNATGDDTNGIIMGGDGNLYAAGSDYDGTYFDPFIYSFTTDGALRWQKVWDAPGNTEAAGVAASGTNKIYLACTYGPPFPEDSDILLLCFDASDGSQLWGKVWGGSQYDRVVGITGDAGGNAWLLCQSSSFSLLNAYSNPIIIKFDSSGNVLFEAAYAIDTDTDATGIGYASLPNAVTLLATDTIVQLNSTGGINWQTQLIASDEMELGRVLGMADGGCYLTGYYNPGWIGGLFAHLDETGSLDYTKAFVYESAHQSLDGLTVYGDLSFVLVGRTKDNAGTWVDYTLTESNPAQPLTLVTGTVADTAVTCVDHDGVLADLPIGTETLDTGGGNTDMSIQRFYPLEPGDW